MSVEEWISDNSRTVFIATALYVAAADFGYVTPIWEMEGAGVAATAGVAALAIGYVAAGRLDDLFPDEEGIYIVAFESSDDTGGAVYELSEDQFADMDVHAGTLFEWPVAKRVYEVKEYRPEENVAVGNWRESVAGSQLAGDALVADAMDQIAELRDEFEPEARKSRHLQRRIRSIVRKLDRRRLLDQQEIIDPTTTPAFDRDDATVSQVVAEEIPDELLPESMTAEEAIGEESNGHGEETVGFELLDDRRTLRLLNYYDGLIDEPIEDTEIGRLIIQNAATRTIDEAVRHGSVSQMKSATGLTGQERDGGDLYADAAAELTHEGAIGLVFGSPGSGKTATTLDVAQTWKVRAGGALIGNTSWDGFDRVVRSDREMLEAMAEIEGPVLALLDEIAQELSGFGSGNKAAEQFSDSLLFIRKKEAQHGPHPKRGSVLLVGHTRTKTAKSIRRVASFAINKPSRSDPGIARLLESEGGKDEFAEAGDYKGLTDTAETYPEHEASEFRIVMEDDADGDDALDADDLKRQEAIDKAIRAVERHGMTYADAGDLVGYSAAWVSDRIAEYRDGDHGGSVNEIEA